MTPTCDAGSVVSNGTRSSNGPVAKRAPVREKECAPNDVGAVSIAGFTLSGQGDHGTHHDRRPEQACPSWPGSARYGTENGESNGRLDDQRRDHVLSVEARGNAQEVAIETKTTVNDATDHPWFCASESCPSRWPWVTCHITVPPIDAVSPEPRPIARRMPGKPAPRGARSGAQPGVRSSGERPFYCGTGVAVAPPVRKPSSARRLEVWVTPSPRPTRADVVGRPQGNRPRRTAGGERLGVRARNSTPSRLVTRA